MSPYSPKSLDGSNPRDELSIWKSKTALSVHEMLVTFRRSVEAKYCNKLNVQQYTVCGTIMPKRLKFKVETELF